MLKEQEENQREQDIEVAIDVHQGDLDEEHGDLLRPQRPQRIKRQPARDCYFTAEEAEAGDPHVVENPAEETTESENDLADGWDEPNSSEDEDFDPDVEMEDIEMV